MEITAENAYNIVLYREGKKQVGPRQVYNTIRDGNDCSEKGRRFIPVKKQSVYNTTNANSYPSLHVLWAWTAQSVQPHATDW